MEKIFRSISDFSRNPVTTIQSLAEKGNMPVATAGYAAGAVSLIAWSGLSAGGFSAGGVAILSVVIFMAIFCAGFMSTCMAHLFLDMGGYTARSKGLFTLIGISQFIKLLLIPAALIMRAAIPTNNLPLLVPLAIELLQFYFVVINTKALYKTSSSRAAIALLLPLAISSAAAITAVVFLLVLIIIGIASAL